MSSMNTLDQSTTEISEQQENLEDISLLWLDVNVFSTDEFYLNTQIRLHSIINHLQLFSNVEECINYIQSIKTEKVFLIVSGSMSKLIVPIIFQSQTVVSIYILCNNKVKHEQWANDYPKIHGVFNDSELLFSKLIKDFQSFCDDFMPISLLSPNVYEKSIRNLSKENASFMWHQLLVKTLIGIVQTDNTAKNELLSICRLQYKDNHVEMKKINEFNDKYDANNAIRWYTRDSFIYRILNKALRTENIDNIFKVRFFIADLHNQLSKLYQIQYKQKTHHHIETIYRGQRLTPNELSVLQENVKGYISTNTFLSATRASNIALVYSGVGSGRPQHESILFEIDIDTSNTSIPFASIGDFSYFVSEDEILFTIGALFQIDSIEPFPTFWLVKLILVDETNEDIKEVNNDLLNEIGDLPSTMTLGSFLIEMKDFNRAEKYHRILLEQLPLNHKDLAMIYNHLGIIYSGRDKQAEAIEYYNKAVTIAEKEKDYLYLVYIYVNIANYFTDKYNHQTSLDYCMKAIDAQEKSLQRDPMRLAAIQTVMGTNYLNMGTYDKAEEHFLHTIDLYHQTLPKNHFYIARSYGDLARLYTEQGDYERALLLEKYVLEIEQKCLPPMHSSIATTHNNIGLIYQYKGLYVEALTKYEMALNMQQAVHSSDHISIGSIYHNIGEVHYHLKNYEMALSSYHKALDILLVSHRHKASKTYNNIGMVLQKQENYAEALINYQKCIDISREFLSSDHLIFGIAYNNIGSVYLDQNNYDIALKHFQQALDIFICSTPFKHPIILTIYNNIALTLYNLRNYKSALVEINNGKEFIMKNNLNLRENDIAEFYFNYGSICIKLNMYDEGINAFNTALQIHLKAPSTDNSKLSIVYESIGTIFYNQSNFLESLKYHRQALELEQKISPSNSERLVVLHNTIGCIYSKLENYDEALKEHSIALQIHLDNNSVNSRMLTTIYDYLGTTYQNQGKFSCAHFRNLLTFLYILNS